AVILWADNAAQLGLNRTAATRHRRRQVNQPSLARRRPSVFRHLTAGGAYYCLTKKSPGPPIILCDPPAPLMTEEPTRGQDCPQRPPVHLLPLPPADRRQQLTKRQPRDLLSQDHRHGLPVRLSQAAAQACQRFDI